MSMLHIRNYYAAKKINFDDHPQSEVRNGQAIILTVDNHIDLILEGVDIVDQMNATLPEGH